MSLITINYSDFKELVRRTTQNPIANRELVDMAMRQELIIYDADNHVHYIIIDETSEDDILSNMKPVFIGYAGIAKYLQIPDTVALKYINLLNIHPIKILNDLSGDGIYLRDQFDMGMQGLAKKIGLNEIDAQLKLGITLDSFRKIKKQIKYSEDGKFLSDLVDALFIRYLPKYTFFSTRKLAIECFVRNFNKKNEDKIEIQYCHDCEPSDLQPASDQCVKCKKYLCPCHAHLLPDQPISSFSPKKICQNCIEQLEKK